MATLKELQSEVTKRTGKELKRKTYEAANAYKSRLEKAIEKSKKAEKAVVKTTATPVRKEY
jgi:hypothetical protein